MRKNAQLKKLMLAISLVAVYAVTIFIALLAYKYLKVITKGILGLTTMYLLLHFARQSKLDMSINALLISPDKGKFFVVAFVSGLVFFWATMLFLEMIWAYLR